MKVVIDFEDDEEYESFVYALKNNLKINLLNILTKIRNEKRIGDLK